MTTQDFVIALFYAVDQEMLDVPTHPEGKLYPSAGGGSVWESNPPSRGLAAITGFEVQAAHQHRYASSL